MDRRALVLYLENVRDLEILKLRIYDLWQKAADSFQKDLDEYPTEVEQPTEVDEKLHLGAFTIWVILSLLFLVGFSTSEANSDYNRTGWFVSSVSSLGMYVFIILFIISSIAAIICLMGAISDNKESVALNKRNRDWYQDALITAKANQSYINKREKEWSKQNSYYSDQYSKAESVLNDFYAMNIIPVQFRGASGACYLYDYMSSSKESFQMALISNQIEEGIKRIEARLDAISRQLSAVLYQQRVIRDENRIEVNRRIASETNMLNTLKALESRQASIEDYSRLLANYSEATALFSFATYLKQ